jgi:two-component system cell cycle response regulator DivK
MRRLRAEARTRRKPIIVLTATSWRVTRARAEQAGCDLFLVKPSLPNELLRQIRVLLSRERR